MEGNKSRLKIIVTVLAAVGIICSSAYIIYDAVWIPYHFRSLGSSFTVEKQQSFNSEESDMPKIQPKYGELKEKYPDFSGELIIEGLDMDFPVVQCGDNSYYLKHTIDGKTDKHGTLFADFRCDLENLSDNTVIYGHNMKDNTQFGMLNVYKKADGCRECPIVEFDTIYKDYRWKIFAAFLINTKPEDDDGYVFDYMKTDFESETDFDDFYKETAERSYFITGTDVKYGDKILTMSTCSTLFDDSRLVVMARLIRDGEDETVNVSKIRQNPDQRFPSAFKNEE